MSVYVDDVRLPFGRMIMCHMWADTVEELLEMADRIGVARKWIQGHPTLSFGKHRHALWVHFDISVGMKLKAIKAGAVMTDRYGPVEHVARLRLKDLSLATEARAREQARLDQIETMRARAKEVAL
jgi:hypothetical protein